MLGPSGSDDIDANESRLHACLSPDRKTHRSESRNNCMHQYLGPLQIRPTAATRSLQTPTKPWSEETPSCLWVHRQPCAGCCSLPASASFPLMLLLLPRATQDTWGVILSHVYRPKHTQCPDRSCSRHVCADHESLQLYWAAQYPRLPENRSSLRENDSSLLDSSALCQLPGESTGRERPRKPHITPLCVSTWWKMTLFVL